MLEQQLYYANIYDRSPTNNICLQILLQLLLSVCGSKEKYRLVRDLHTLKFHLNSIRCDIVLCVIGCMIFVCIFYVMYFAMKCFNLL